MTISPVLLSSLQCFLDEKFPDTPFSCVRMSILMSCQKSTRIVFSCKKLSSFWSPFSSDFYTTILRLMLWKILFTMIIDLLMIILLCIWWLILGQFSSLSHVLLVVCFWFHHCHLFITNWNVKKFCKILSCRCSFEDFFFFCGVW